MNRWQARRAFRPVFCSLQVKTSTPFSRTRAGSRVKSISDEIGQNRQKGALCNRSIASITSAISEAFFPVA
jgi:hypothetical protein